MASRAFSVPGIAFLTIALILLIIASISLPSLSAMDFVRVHIDNPPTTVSNLFINQIRFGIWSFCEYDASNGDRNCSPKGHGYTVQLGSITSEGDVDVSTIGSSWTRGLAIHPVAAAATFIACACSFSQHLIITLAFSFLAAFITLIAFSCDIALYGYVKHKVGSLNNLSADTNTGPAFWLTFVSLVLLLLAGCTVFFGQRRARMSSATDSYPMTSSGKQIWKRFRRIY